MKKTTKSFNSTLNKVSDKQAQINKVWQKITDEKAREVRFICQLCGKLGQRHSSMAVFTYLDGHHIIPRRFNIHTKENCYIVHRISCHEKADRIIREYPSEQ